MALYHELLEGYTLSADNDMKDALLKRTDVLLSWPTNDLLGSKVLTALALGYDMLYDELTAETKQQILTTIDKQFKEGLARWPGFTEARQVENHFWQMELTIHTACSSPVSLTLLHKTVVGTKAKAIIA